jgi:hypothetical protein
MTLACLCRNGSRRFLFVLFSCCAVCAWLIGYGSSLGYAITSSTATLSSRPFWRFISVTSEANLAKAVVVAKSWGSQVTQQWYAEGKASFPKELGSVVRVQEPAYLEGLARGEGYKHMMFKMQWVWDHALNHGPNASW